MKITQIPPTPELVKMFEQINKDCEESGEGVVELTDIDYYSDQIANIFEVDEDTARVAAEQMAEFIKNK
jgi:hypothetical protein